MNTFETLEVYKVCRNLRKDIIDFVRGLPDSEKYRLVDQLRRSSRSVTANIAEGYGRFHYQENIQFCRQARGSLYEILDHYSCALDEGYISEEMYGTKKLAIEYCVKLLNGYILYLKKRKEGTT